MNQLIPSALLFDMDGVLVDSFDSWLKSLNQALKHEPQKPISKETFADEYWGYTLQENLERLGISKENAQFCTSFYDQYTDEIILFSGAKETLEQLQRYPKAIITNTPKTCTQKILEKFNIQHHFSVRITSDQIEKGKPEPDMIFKACHKLHVKPDSVVLIGDTQNDIKAGHAAGCKTIGIKTEADYTIDSIKELLDIIKS